MNLTTRMKARDYYPTIGKNVMTPTTLAYFDIDDGRMVELTEGTGFTHNPIFGMTVTGQDQIVVTGAGGLFGSEADARAHIETLQIETLQQGNK